MVYQNHFLSVLTFIFSAVLQKKKQKIHFQFFSKIFILLSRLLYKRGKELESAQEISKISRCFVLWEP